MQNPGELNRFSQFCDDFYINMNLSTEMELPTNRDTILHYFERVQKSYPSMRKFYCRDKRDFVLEEEKERGNYRWTAVESKRVCSGQVNPPSIGSALDQHRLILELAPYMLSLSPLDCEAMDVLFAFDFTYRGNHNQLVAEALGLNAGLERMIDVPGATVMNYEPSITLALDEECRSQVRLSIETRTSAFHVRTGEYPEDQLSVYLTARQYGSLSPDTTYVQAFDRLATATQELVDGYVIDQILQPLARTIAMK
ncbi:MAG: hypothetical protein SGJ20_21050 [Planctomycetota bacterium]|nr:hypothetical protein [Planctomycetota bacterium]